MEAIGLVWLVADKADKYHNREIYSMGLNDSLRNNSIVESKGGAEV